MSTNRYQVSLFQHHPVTKEVPAGTAVFKAGDPNNKLMYSIKSGKVAVTLPDGLLDELGPNEIFGEMALIENMPRLADVTAVTDTVLIEIDEAHFLSVLRANPYFGLQMMKILSARVRASKTT
jgi:CRP/FNR family cyclic AMP-dependent transcriptional regulator